MDKFKAREKIKKHIRSQGKTEDFEVTHTLIYYWWNLLNYAIFDSILEYPKRVTIRNIKDQKGACYPLKEGFVGLQMDKEFDNKEQFIEVLVHEMVHAYQWQLEGKMTHGKTFFKWKPKITQQLRLPFGRLVEVQ